MAGLGPYVFKTGTFTGTGSAITEATIGSLGFKPGYIKIWNETDGDETWEYVDGLADGKAYTNGPSTTDLALQADNAITVSNTGFSVGTDISESGDTFRYIAFSGGD